MARPICRSGGSSSAPRAKPQPIQTIEAATYLLAGQSQAWPLADAVAGQRSLQLEAETNLGPIQAAVDLPQG